jgi:hypothetical protein
MPARPRAEEPPTYERDVRPLLFKRCTICHAAKRVGDLERSGGLALDSFEAILAGVPAHKVVIAGKPAESILYQRLISDDDERRMPRDDEPLDDNERALLRRWIEAGLPRGERGTSPPSAGAARRRPSRSLDIALPATRPAPRGWLIADRGGPLHLVARVGPLPPVTALAFRDDGRLLAVGSDRHVVLWDLHEGQPAAALPEQPGTVHGLAFSRDGRRLAIGSGLAGRGGSARVYTVPDGTLLADFGGHADIVSAVAIRPDGAQLATASFDQTVRFWDLIEREEQGAFEGHSDFVHDLAYAPDGRTLFSCGKDRSVKQIDTTTFQGLRTFSGHDEPVLAVATRPGGGFVSAGDEPALCWWAPSGEKPERKQRGHGAPVHALAFSRDGRRLISASADRSVRTWDAATGAPLKTLTGATDWQYAAALSADGTLAASGGFDGIVRVWDAEAGRLRGMLIQPPRSEGPGCEWLAMSPPGYFGASPGLLGLVRARVENSEAPTDSLQAVLHRPAFVGMALRGENTEPLPGR